MSRDEQDDWHDEPGGRSPPRRSYGAHGEDEILGRGEVNRFARDAFREGNAVLANAKIGETKKFLGMFSMDAGIVDMLDGLYNLGADFVSSNLRPHVFRIVEKLSPRVGLSPDAARSAAVIATIGSTAAIKMGGYFGTIYEGVSSQFRTQSELARTIAPVLDEIKGNHSIAALYTVGLNDNELIYAHRNRLGRIASTTNLSNVISLGINSGTSLLFDAQGLYNIWNRRAALSHDNVNSVLSATDKASPVDVHDASAENMDGKRVFKAGLISMLPQAAAHVAATSQHTLMTQLQPYSALEMILELEKQVSSSPEARGFDVPHSFQSPHAHRQQYTLEEYLMRICIQHQKDMADISSDHSEIREALREDLAASMKPVAAAIRKGELSVMSLVRLVGEGKIIRKHGRAIARADDVAALIVKEAPKRATYVQVDPAEYYKDAAFSHEQLKAALKSLDGEEKSNFCAMFPDAILAEAGMNKKEIRKVREETGKYYDRMLGEAIIGLSVQSDEHLGSRGLSGNEIKEVRRAAEQIAQQGITAVHDLKTSSVHENGLEHLISNVVVHQPEYLGKVLNDGRKKFTEIAADDDAAGEITKRAHGRMNISGDENYSHAAHVESRRTGTDDAYAVVDY